MLNKTDQPPPQGLLRHRCRNARCGTALKIPATNSRDAFCSPDCERQFYARHCRVCGQLFSPKATGKPRQVCGRSACRHEFQRHPEQYELRCPGAKLGHNPPETGTRYPRATLGQNSARSAHLAGLKIGLEAGRASPHVAGPECHELNYLPPDLTDPKIAAAHVANAKHWRQAKKAAERKALIGPTMPPGNIVGGYKFPNAPELDLSPVPKSATRVLATRVSATNLTGDGLDIADFLKRSGWAPVISDTPVISGTPALADSEEQVP